MSENEPEVTLRPETNADVPFLRSLYATTRVDVTFSGLPEEQKKHFIDMQFNAQRTCYYNDYPNIDFSIIEVNRRPAGRLYLSRMPEEIRVMDISVLPAFRNKGIGSRLLRMVQDEARSRGLSVTLHAEKFGNMARFYERLGFEVTEEKQEHFFMKWTASSAIIT